MDFAFDSFSFFGRRESYLQCIGWTEAGRLAAMRQGLELNVAALLGNLGNIYEKQGRYDDAIEYYQKVS